MAIDPRRLSAQRAALALAPEPGEEPLQAAPRSRPVARACAGGCGAGTRDRSGLCPACQAMEAHQVVERLTVEELHQIITAARAELARRADLASQILSTT